MMAGLREMVLMKETAEQGVCNGLPAEKEEECPVLVPAQDTSNNSDEYFTSYNDVEVHRLMIQDKARTTAYQNAILNNSHIFKDKIVMDIGAGTGILSLFAKKAGAKKVFAVEASPLVDVLKEIIELNDEEKVIEVIHGKAEEVDLSEGVKVDIIISEWMGFYLLHESMLDSVILAREKHLAEDGLMLPSHAKILAAPVQLDIWVGEQFNSWGEVYGFNMTPMAQRAMEIRMEKGQPEIMSLKEDNLLSEPVVVAEFDMKWVQREEVISVEDRKFLSITKSGNFHGLAVWFDTLFDPMIYDGEYEEPFAKVDLNTGPCDPETHWKQTVLVVPGNMAEGEVEEDEIIGWSLTMAQSGSNARQYSLGLEVLDPSTEEHPVPCDCKMGKCALMKALLEQEDKEMQDLEEL